jgi:hypothetical protein
MPTAAQIKAAAHKLPVKDRADLLEALAGDEAVRKERLARLQALVGEGERDLAKGRYTEIRTPAELRAFFDGIKRRALERTKRSA